MSSFDLMGYPISTDNLDQALERVKNWVSNQTSNGCRYVIFTPVHVVYEASHCQRYQEAFLKADIRFADGMPLVWISHWKKASPKLKAPTTAPDFMWEFFRRYEHSGLKHFFFGSTHEIVESLISRAQHQFPGLNIAGFHCPPMRSAGTPEDPAVISSINQSGADMIWVGLGCPKQELWMSKHRHQLHAKVMLGVGQSFDIHSGKRKRAPLWMRQLGLEWFYRLCAEPKRLFKRYIVFSAVFFFKFFIYEFKKLFQYQKSSGI